MRNDPKVGGGVMLCGRMHARLYPQTRQNDSYDDSAATVPAPPLLLAHKWLLCASVNLGAEMAGHDEQGTIQQEMSALSGFDQSKTGEDEKKERGETALGSLAKSAGSVHSHPEFNFIMCSWNHRSNNERYGEREGGRERGWSFSIMKTGQKSFKQRERPTINYRVRK